MCSSSNKNRWPVARVEAEGTDTCKMSFFPDLFICLLFFVVVPTVVGSHVTTRLMYGGKTPRVQVFLRSLVSSSCMHPRSRLQAHGPLWLLVVKGNLVVWRVHHAPSQKRKRAKASVLFVWAAPARERGLDTSHLITSILAAVSRGRLVYTIKCRLHCLELGLVVAPHLS